VATEQIRWDDIDFAADPPVRTPATETVTFTFADSGPMQIDLSEAHAKEFAELVAPWLSAASTLVVAQPARATRARRSNASPAGASTADRTPAELKAYRAWETGQGNTVEKYSGGGYKYDPERLAAYDAHLAKSDK
jgi:hypothetical protein